MMRMENEIKELIVDFAERDDRVRAVLLNGSRANPKVLPDPYQDYDIVYVVRDFQSFIDDRKWLSFLGNIILKQTPGDMDLENENSENDPSYTFLMIFDDDNRIDLTLFPLENFPADFKTESLTRIWMDKDNLFGNFPEPDDRDHYILKPEEKGFLEVCNEFWWVSAYVAKGLARGQLIYAKDIMETTVRPMFMKMVGWKIGAENDFGISIGKSGKFLKQHVSEEFYNRILKTYSTSDPENNWDSLFEMMFVFKEIQIEIAEKLDFRMNATEADNAINYNLRIRNSRRSDRSRVYSLLAMPIVNNWVYNKANMRRNYR